MRASILAPIGCALALLVGCGSADSGGAAQPGPDAGGGDAGADAPLKDDAATTDAATDGASEAAGVSCDEKAASCASEFGALFTRSNGRADGTLVALVRPQDQQCALPNGTHVTLQLEMLGQVQRLVVSVDGVGVTTTTAPLIGPAYEAGWHPDVVIDYPSEFGVHSDDFTSVTLSEAVDFICSHMEIGAPVSVYAYSDGSKPSSAHQIHRNDNYPDGAVVANPTSPNPTWLLFRYQDQVF